MQEKSLVNAKLNIIEENYKVIKDKIEKAAGEVNRNPDEIRLMAVTKTVEPIYINHAIKLGINLIGENRVQEFLEKEPFLEKKVETHIIGHLQRNKVSKIIGRVDMIQSLDSIRLAEEISKQALKAETQMPVLIEVNIGREESKTGFDPDELTESVYQISELKGVKIKGLMCVPPICDSESEAAAFFNAISKLFIDIKDKKIDNVDMCILSAGMSSDYETAIRCGSNLIRIGSALFGARIY
ncbi:MAG: YggS family pyridoxal phosphate-dependent enzyme [Clostridiales bacterium]|jgi:pyridoxal phosphate enzyme (YggS family)|nr:YggS family pyridoxal phosphate-dependent enzyme [Clostridiales bacterium]